jgi:hypothetical protein
MSALPSCILAFDMGTPNPTACNGAGDFILSQGNYVVHDKPVLNFSALHLLLGQFEQTRRIPTGRTESACDEPVGRSDVALQRAGLRPRPLLPLHPGGRGRRMRHREN